jgi:hypothetical protein
MFWAQLLAKVTENESIQAKLRDQDADDMLVSEDQQTITGLQSQVQL